MTATALQLSPQDRTLTAKVANWDAFQTTEYTAQDIASVTIQEGIVWIHFHNNTATAIDTATFKAKIAEYKAQSQLSEEQQEIIEAAIDCPFQSEVNFQDAIASFYSDETRFVGTVRREGDRWLAIVEHSKANHSKLIEQADRIFSHAWSHSSNKTMHNWLIERADRIFTSAWGKTTTHRTASDAVHSLTTCTYEEWENAQEGLIGYCYEGNGFWRYGNGRTNTRNLLDILHLTKTDREIAIIEQRILIAD